MLWSLRANASNATTKLLALASARSIAKVVPVTGIPVAALVEFGKGIALEESGDRAGAATAYRAAVAASPGFTEARVALQRVGG